MAQKIKTIKVLMVGGRRCGKTTALASMYEQIIHGPIKTIFTMRDSTKYEKDKVNIYGKLESQETLEEKILDLRGYLEQPPTGTFLVDSGPTGCVWTYGLGLKIPGTKKEMSMEFLDCPGEFYQQGTHDEEVDKFIEDSDVCVVMVDTPYLMECGNSVARGVNCIGSIENFLKKFVAMEKKNAKMVIFVPIKCEKWAKEGHLGDVIDKVKESYDSLIAALAAHPYMHIAVIPIQTAGSIEFMEMKDAYVLITKEMDESGNLREKAVKCDKVSEKLIRLSKGTLRPKKNGEIVNLDMEAVITSNVKKPNAWFHIRDNKCQKGSSTKNDLYAPYNCEQLPLHILRFWFDKAISIASGGIWGSLKSFFFGNITLEEMQERLEKLQKLGSIKDNVDGIEYINRPKF